MAGRGTRSSTKVKAARRLVLHANTCYASKVKSNITLKLDAGLLREVRVLAAEEGTSVSALLSGRLEELVRERRAYERAKKSALKRLRTGWDLGWAPPRSRDELHER